MNGDGREDLLRCPTCNAEQIASPQCRRCRCDLTLLVAARRRAAALHEEFLRQLGDEAYGDALQTALRRFHLLPDGRAHRLLSLAYLYVGKYQSALHVHDRASGRR